MLFLSRNVHSWQQLSDALCGPTVPSAGYQATSPFEIIVQRKGKIFCKGLRFLAAGMPPGQPVGRQVLHLFSLFPARVVSPISRKNTRRSFDSPPPS